MNKYKFPFLISLMIFSSSVYSQTTNRQGFIDRLITESQKNKKKKDWPEMVQAYRIAPEERFHRIAIKSILK